MLLIYVVLLVINELGEERCSEVIKIRVLFSDTVALQLLVFFGGRWMTELLLCILLPSYQIFAFCVR
jgi:hypothetical protein